MNTDLKVGIFQNLHEQMKCQKWKQLLLQHENTLKEETMMSTEILLWIAGEGKQVQLQKDMNDELVKRLFLEDIQLGSQ